MDDTVEERRWLLQCPDREKHIFDGLDRMHADLRRISLASHHDGENVASKGR